MKENVSGCFFLNTVYLRISETHVRWLFHFHIRWNNNNSDVIMDLLLFDVFHQKQSLPNESILLLWKLLETGVGVVPVCHFVKLFIRSGSVQAVESVSDNRFSCCSAGENPLQQFDSCRAAVQRRRRRCGHSWQPTIRHRYQVTTTLRRTSAIIPGPQSSLSPC